MMTPRKTHSRRHGSHHARQHSRSLLPSDYESDYQYTSSDQIPPTIAQPTHARSIDEVNLAVLQRHNPEILTVLAKSSYAVVYVFNPAGSSWEKSGVEGTLFICQLLPGVYGEDRYNVILLNRRGLDTFEAPLLDGDDVEITDEYVILNVREAGSSQDPAQKVYGLWIFCDANSSETVEARLENAHKMKECAAFAGQSRRLAMAKYNQRLDGSADPVVSAPGQQMDLLQLFNKHNPQVAQQPQQFVFNDQNHQDYTFVAHADGSRHAQPGPQPIPQQSDVLGDLFRRAGLGTR